MVTLAPLQYPHPLQMPPGIPPHSHKLMLPGPSNPSPSALPRIQIPRPIEDHPPPWCKTPSACLNTSSFLLQCPPPDSRTFLDTAPSCWNFQREVTIVEEPVVLGTLLSMAYSPSHCISVIQTQGERSLSGHPYGPCEREYLEQSLLLQSHVWSTSRCSHSHWKLITDPFKTLWV
jgi:hypothetical protein